MNRVLVRSDRLNTEIVGRKRIILGLLESIELAVGGCEPGVMAEVGEGNALGPTLSRQVVLGVGRVQ